MLATGGLTEKDVKPVLVPNVIRGADDFVSGAADMFFFAFGAPKVREVDATVGGIRVLEINEGGMPAARKISPLGLSDRSVPGPVFVGVEKPMKVYTFDNMLFTNAKVQDDVRLQDHRDAGEEQGRSGRRAAGAARVLGRRPLQEIRHPLSPRRPEILQGQGPGRRAPRPSRSERGTHRPRRGGVRLRRVAGDGALRPTSCRRCWSPSSCCGCSTSRGRSSTSRSIPSSC